MKERQIDVYLNLIFHQHGTSHVQTITGQMKYSVTMKQYFEKIILPYVNEKRKELKLSIDHPALLIFDNFKAQTTSSILKFWMVIIWILFCCLLIALTGYSCWIYQLIIPPKIFCAHSFRTGIPKNCTNNYKNNLLK